jgi:hypothetical protein
METKFCTKCKVEKPRNDFCKNKRIKDGYHYHCKTCTSKTIPKGTTWKLSLRLENKKYCASCDTVKSFDDFHKLKTNKIDGCSTYCKPCKFLADKKYIQKLKDSGLYKESKNNEYKKNIETYKRWTKNRIRDYKKEYRIEQSNELRKFKSNLRKRINVAFKYRDWTKHKNNDLKILLGCSCDEAKLHIESLWVEGMSWINYGKYGWHIDHIIPLASAKTKEDMLPLFHYKNMQPLWAFDNLSKGSKY